MARDVGHSTKISKVVVGMVLENDWEGRDNGGEGQSWLQSCTPKLHPLFPAYFSPWTYTS